VREGRSGRIAAVAEETLGKWGASFRQVPYACCEAVSIALRFPTSTSTWRSLCDSYVLVQLVESCCWP